MKTPPPAATLKFRGELYARLPLAANLFVEAWQPLRKAAPANSIRAVPFDAAANKTTARRHLRQILKDTLENHPGQLEKIVNDSEQAMEDFNAGMHPARHHLEAAIVNYISPGFPYHVFLDAAMLGHGSLRDFMQAMDGGPPPSAEKVEEYCRSLLDCHALGECPDTESVAERFDSESQIQAAALKAYLKESPILDGITLAHGVVTHMDERFSVGVNARAYLSAFIHGHPIHYRIPLSTTAAAATACDFSANKDLVLDDPAEFLDIDDASSLGMTRKRAMLAQIEALGDGIETEAILHFLRCRNAQGAWLPQNDVEQELLLSSGHVLIPKRVIRGRDYFVLIAEATRVQES